MTAHVKALLSMIAERSFELWVFSYIETYSNITYNFYNSSQSLNATDDLWAQLFGGWTQSLQAYALEAPNISISQDQSRSLETSENTSASRAQGFPLTLDLRPMLTRCCCYVWRITDQMSDISDMKRRQETQWGNDPLQIWVMWNDLEGLHEYVRVPATFPCSILNWFVSRTLILLITGPQSCWAGLQAVRTLRNLEQVPLLRYCMFFRCHMIPSMTSLSLPQIQMLTNVVWQKQLQDM